MIMVVYVDDQIDNSYTKMIKELLTEADKIECSIIAPALHFADITNLEMDIFLIDFDLASTPPQDGYLISYHGNSLATEIRTSKPNCPIVFVTRKEILQGVNLSSRFGVADLVLFKSDILDNKLKAKNDILTLYDGFKTLASGLSQPWSYVLQQMGATKEEAIKMREAFPPIEDKGQWRVSVVAEWIREVIMKYPGILYDELHAATRLGITIEEFQTADIQGLFAAAEYNGIFSGFGKRWWVDRLLENAAELMLAADIEGAISNKLFEALQISINRPVQTAVCVYDKTPIADQVCYLLKQPVKRQNSILYYPDNRPPIMDAARVSINAIREAESFDEDLVDADGRDVVQELWGV